MSKAWVPSVSLSNCGVPSSLLAMYLVRILPMYVSWFSSPCPAFFVLVPLSCSHCPAMFPSIFVPCYLFVLLLSPTLSVFPPCFSLSIELSLKSIHACTYFLVNNSINKHCSIENMKLVLPQVQRYEAHQGVPAQREIWVFRALYLQVPNGARPPLL